MNVAIIQARMGSSRLPGKVLKRVDGRSLLSYLLERVAQAKGIDVLIVATTNQAEDDQLAAEAKSLGANVFRGSENDLLARYWGAYNSLTFDKKISGIIRITADCPLIEPEIIENVIHIFSTKGYDYVTTDEKMVEGLDVEIFSPKILEEAFSNATLASEREHPTQYFHNNSKKFNIFKYDTGEDLGRYRITVDEPEDYEVVEKIIQHFNKTKEKMTFSVIREFLDNNPDIFHINSKIIRNEGLKNSLLNDRNCVQDEK